VGPGILLVGGLLLCLRWAIALPRLWRTGDPTLAGGLLVTVWLLVPFLYFGLVVRPVLDRYPVLGVPAGFLAIGVATAWGAGRLARGHPFLETALVVLVAGIAAVPLLRSADRIVRGKMTSYGELRDAGHWIAAHSDPTEQTMSASVAQLTYYSVRPNLRFPKDADEFVRVLRDAPPRYVVLSGFERHPVCSSRSSPSSAWESWPGSRRRASPRSWS
jgi:hypothetical protein